jgi:hypothetical protein
MIGLLGVAIAVCFAVSATAMALVLTYIGAD